MAPPRKKEKEKLVDGIEGPKSEITKNEGRSGPRVEGSGSAQGTGEQEKKRERGRAVKYDSGIREI